MDRNNIGSANIRAYIVALRKESVDRNIIVMVGLLMCNLSLSARRAWIEIGIVVPPKADKAKSLSARRAWIEIVITAMTSQISVVALRKESVDRNGMEVCGVSYDVWSLSARRAWIEIRGLAPGHARKAGRSPQGERG